MRKILMIALIWMLSLTRLAFAAADPGGCPEVRLDSFKIVVAEQEDNAELRLMKGTEVLQKVDPYIDGPGNRCLKLQAFSKSKFVLLEFFHGTTGTSKVVERNSLQLYQLKERKLILVKEFELKSVEFEDAGEKVIFEKTYSVQEDKNKLKVKIREPKNKKSSEHVF